MKRKLLIIAGPTATGKTSLGIKLAQELNGEIISADSRQIYQKMDIGTGKDIGKARFKEKNLEIQLKNQKEKLKIGTYKINNIPIWGLDLIEPNQKFSVAQWLELARLVTQDIWQRNKLPLVVGGAGFWIKTLIEGGDSLGSPPDWKLRKELERLDGEQLKNQLEKLDPQRLEKMNRSDRNNPRRLIRAIELAQKEEKKSLPPLEIDELLVVGLKATNKFLYRKIDRRVDKRIRQGIQQEIERLLEAGYSFENSILGGTIGYQEWQAFFEKRTSLKKVAQAWKYQEHGYARRQITFFKKMFSQFNQQGKEARWFNLEKVNWQKEVVKLAKSWYDEQNGKN